MFKKKNKRILILPVLVILLIIGVLIIKGISKDEYEVTSRVSNTKKMSKEYSEVIGWLKVQGTNIDYPVVDFNKVNVDEMEYDFVWKNTSTKKIEDKVTIVGHNIKNVSKEPILNDSTMTRFEQLMSFVYYDFAKDNEYIQYTVDGKEYVYKIYAVTFSTTDEENNSLTFKDTKEKEEYIKKVKKNSLFDYDIDVDKDDKLISLVTCTRMFGYDNTDVKFKVEGRLVRKNENKKSYKVEKSKNYDDILGGSLL